MQCPVEATEMEETHRRSGCSGGPIDVAAQRYMQYFEQCTPPTVLPQWRRQIKSALCMVTRALSEVLPGENIAKYALVMSTGYGVR